MNIRDGKDDSVVYIQYRCSVLYSMKKMILLKESLWMKMIAEPM